MTDHDDFDIELGPATRRHSEYKRSPLEDRALCAVPFDRPETDEVPVFIHERVIRAIEAQSAAEKEHEVGGVLLGSCCRSGDRIHIQITDFIKAESTRATDVSVTFTHETWERINAEQTRRGDGARIVGWYHSHPGLGVFMSKEDEFIHSNYFADPLHIALVVDPIRHDWGCFKWVDARLTRAGGFYVFEEKRAARRVRDLVRTLNTSRLSGSATVGTAPIRAFGSVRMAPLMWTLVVLMIIWQVIMGYLLFSRTGSQPEAMDNYATAMKLLAASDLSGGAEYLRQELVKNPHNDAAYKELDRLHNILADPLFIAAEDDKLDEINLMLVMADEMAVGRPQYRQRSDLEGLLPKSEGEGNANIEETQPAAKAFRIYSQLADSHGARLNRALLVQRIARTLYPPPARSTEASRRLEESAWYNAVVKWLEEEDARRVAYGLQSGDRSAAKEFDVMSDSQRAVVRRIRAELADPR